MSAAIFGLLGVIVGAFLNSLLGWQLERRRDRIALKAAARLLDSELKAARVAALSALREHEWRLLRPEGRVPSIASWPVYRQLFAAQMNYEDFAVVARGVAGWEQVLGVASEEDRSTIGSRVVVQYFLEEQVDVAVKHLGRYLGLEERPSRATTA